MLFFKCFIIVCFEVYFLEFMNFVVSKGNVLVMLIDYLNLIVDEVMVIGD